MHLVLLDMMESLAKIGVARNHLRLIISNLAGALLMTEAYCDHIRQDLSTVNVARYMPANSQSYLLLDVTIPMWMYSQSLAEQPLKHNVSNLPNTKKINPISTINDAGYDTKLDNKGGS